MKTKPPAGEPLAIPLKFGIEVDLEKEFTRKDRVKILFGYKVIIEVRIGTQHHPGHFSPIVNLKTSPEPREQK